MAKRESIMRSDWSFYIEHQMFVCILYDFYAVMLFMLLFCFCLSVMFSMCLLSFEFPAQGPQMQMSYSPNSGIEHVPHMFPVN